MKQLDSLSPTVTRTPAPDKGLHGQKAISLGYLVLGMGIVETTRVHPETATKV